jgi:hypothetical protein
MDIGKSMARPTIQESDVEIPKIRDASNLLQISLALRDLAESLASSQTSTAVRYIMSLGASCPVMNNTVETRAAVRRAAGRNAGR